MRENNTKLNNRNSRTRTLIQLGGLLDLTPLLSICGIELGDDLQVDHRDKSAALLGMLSYFCGDLPEDITTEELERFKEMGIKLLQHERKGNV